MIAYTIGHERSYDTALLKPPVYKIGATSDPTEPTYPGGWVWRSEADARAFLVSYPEFAVYELRLPASWAECVTTQPADDGVHTLIFDAEIIRKIPPPPRP